MAGWQDYGFYPGGICTMAQQWVAVEGLAAAFNERIALFEDTGYRKHFVKFDITKHDTPGRALLNLAKAFFHAAFFSSYLFDRKFRDCYAWCVDNPLSGDFISKTQVEQRDLALAWLGNYFGFETAEDADFISTSLFKFRPWGEACRNLYLLINNWHYHYELADLIIFIRYSYSESVDNFRETCRKAFEAGEAAGWSVYDSNRYSFSKQYDYVATRIGSVTFIPSGYPLHPDAECYVRWPPRGAGFCAREDMPDIASCAFGYIAMMGECNNWASLSAVYPPGTILTARAQPGVECYSPFANWSFVPEPDNFNTCDANCRRALVCYDLAPKLSFYRAEDRIVKN